MIKKTSDQVLGLQKYFLLGTMLLFVGLLFKFFSPFLGTLFIAAVLVTTIYPFYKWIMRRLRLKKGLAALSVLLAVVVVVIVPLTFFFFSLVEQAAEAYKIVNGYITEIVQSDSTLPFLEKYPRLQELGERLAPLSLKETLSMVGNAVGSISSFLFGQAANIVKHVTVVILHLVVFVLAIFYFLKDGDRLMAYIRSLLPLKPQYRQELFTKMHDLMHSIVFGIFGAALAQAAMLGLGLALAGVENALFWSALGALFAPIPYVGIGLVWVPMVISLFIGDHFNAGIFLIIWCELLVVNVDNIVKPYLIGVRTMLHPFAVLLVIFGGVMAFGLKGLIFGPFVLTMALAFIHIYRMEYQEVLKEKK